MDGWMDDCVGGWRHEWVDKCLPYQPHPPPLPNSSRVVFRKIWVKLRSKAKVF
jgi:hypothetical protein